MDIVVCFIIAAGIDGVCYYISDGYKRLLEKWGM